MVGKAPQDYVVMRGRGLLSPDRIAARLCLGRGYCEGARARGAAAPSAEEPWSILD